HDAHDPFGSCGSIIGAGGPGLSARAASGALSDRDEPGRSAALRQMLGGPALAGLHRELLHELDRALVLGSRPPLDDAVGHGPVPEIPALGGPDDHEGPALTLTEPPERDVRVLGREVRAVEAPGAGVLVRLLEGVGELPTVLRIEQELTLDVHPHDLVKVEPELLLRDL